MKIEREAEARRVTTGHGDNEVMVTVSLEVERGRPLVKPGEKVKVTVEIPDR